MPTGGITGGLSKIGRPGTQIRGPLYIRIYNPPPGQTGTGGFQSLEVIDSRGNYVSILLTPAQVKSLKATPVQLLPPRTDGRIWIPNVVTYSVQFATTAYAAGGNVDITYGSLGQPFGMLCANTVINSASSQIKIVPSQVLTIAAGLAFGQGIYIANVGAAEFTTGDSPVLISMQYDLGDI